MSSFHLCFRLDLPSFISKQYDFFQIGHSHEYFDKEETLSCLHHLCDKCYLPTNTLLLKMINEFNQNNRPVKFSFDISNQVFELLETYRPDVIASFQALAKTNCVEFLCSNNSMLLFLLQNNNVNEALLKRNKTVQLRLKESIITQKRFIKQLFGKDVTTFVNHSILYSDLWGEYYSNLGFKAMIVEGSKNVLGWRSPNFVYQSQTNFKLKLLFRNYILSDLLTFKFNDQHWLEHPLTAEKLAFYIMGSLSESKVVNLVFDYDLFGSQFTAEEGIHDLLYHLPLELFKYEQFNFRLPAELIASERPVAKIGVTSPTSSSGLEKDASEWYGNNFQQGLLDSLYNLERKVKQKKNQHLIPTWEKLLHADYFSFLDTQWKDPHHKKQYNNPFDSPEEAYIVMSNIIADLSLRLQ